MGRKSNRWLGLIALMPALAMSFLDQSVLPVALPTIQKEMHTSINQLIWAVNAYLLATAVLVLMCGKVSDWIGHRRAFCVGMILFGSASLFCALSLNGLALILSRVIQGLGAAFIIPSSTAILMSLFPPHERGKATGINVSFGSIFLILGPLIGGYLTEHYSWRWIFLINIPLTIAGMLLTLFFIPRSPKVHGKIDFPSFFYFLISCTIFVIILMQGREWGWSSDTILVLSAFCLIALVLLVYREKITRHPYLDLSLFENSLFKAVNLSIFAVQFVLMITLFWAIYFQKSLGWSPTTAGFIIFLCSVPVLFIAPLVGYLMDRFGPKWPIAAGFSILIASLIWIAFTMESHLLVLLVGLFGFGIGISLILTPSYATAMSAIPPTKAGLSFGTIQTLRSLSSALGVAVIGSLFDNFESEHTLIIIQLSLALLLFVIFFLVLRWYTETSSGIGFSHRRHPRI